ncbi:MAG: choice-of-anchor D domain-containing protein [Thermomicrobiales bacterium]
MARAPGPRRVLHRHRPLLPRHHRPKSTALRFGTDAPGSPHLVSLTGNGVASPPTAPGIAFSPAAVAFGNQTVGTLSGSRSVTVTNTGTANLVITSVALSGGETADFPNLTTNCATLAPGAQCIITLAFAPNAVGNRATNIVVVDNVPSAGSAQIIPVSGIGIAPGTPSVGLNPPSVDFGDQQVNTQSGAQAVTITNTGTATLTLSNAPVLFGGDTSQFQIVSDGCWSGSGSLAPGASCTVTVRFFPGTTGQKSSALRFNTNASSGPHLVSLTGA